MKIAIIVVSCITIYGFMAGMTFGLVDRVWKLTKRDVFDENPVAVVLSILWPVCLPACYAMSIVKTWGERMEEKQMARKLELAKALGLPEEERKG